VEKIHGKKTFSVLRQPTETEAVLLIASSLATYLDERLLTPV